jgi:3-isopropylmalate dehydrogenase
MAQDCYGYHQERVAGLDHQLVDSAAMVMVANPRKLNGVILTENMFGDMYV